MTTNTSALVACPECDCLQREVPLVRGGNAACARCGAELFRRHPETFDRTLAFLLAAAILFVLANAYPVMTLDAKGMRTASTILGTALALHEHGMTSVALLVFAVAILFPAVELAAMLYLLVPLHLGIAPRGFPLAFRLVRRARPWGMEEVFILGALVSLVKLTQIAKVHPGLGLYSIGAFILLLAAAEASFEPRALWARYESLRR